jgi:hypothetical protein
MANRCFNYQLIQKTSDQSNGCSTSNLIETIGTGVGNQSLLISGLQFDLKPKPKSITSGFFTCSLKNLIFLKIFHRHLKVFQRFKTKVAFLKVMALHHRSFKKPITNAFPFQKNWMAPAFD